MIFSELYRLKPEKKGRVPVTKEGRSQKVGRQTRRKKTLIAIGCLLGVAVIGLSVFQYISTSDSRFPSERKCVGTWVAVTSGQYHGDKLILNDDHSFFDEASGEEGTWRIEQGESLKLFFPPASSIELSWSNGSFIRPFGNYTVCYKKE